MPFIALVAISAMGVFVATRKTYRPIKPDRLHAFASGITRIVTPTLKLHAIAARKIAARRGDIENTPVAAVSALLIASAGVADSRAKQNITVPLSACKRCPNESKSLEVNEMFHVMFSLVPF
jgi:hypothetical protein